MSRSKISSLDEEIFVHRGSEEDFQKMSSKQNKSPTVEIRCRQVWPRRPPFDMSLIKMLSSIICGCIFKVFEESNRAALSFRHLKNIINLKDGVRI